MLAHGNGSMKQLLTRQRHKVGWSEEMSDHGNKYRKKPVSAINAGHKNLVVY